MEYRIGDFALITRLTVKSLRYYQEEGLLEPTRTDLISGYRYYGEELIPRARMITTLRDWGFSIKEIREILLEHSDDSELLDIVRRKRAEISRSIREMKKIDEELALFIRLEKESEKMKDNPVITVKEIEEVKMISVTYRGKYEECGKYMGKLFKIAGSKIAGPVFNRYPDMEYSEEAEVEVCLPVKKKISSPDAEYKVLPACRVITTIHTGPYGDLGKAYKRIIDYLNEYGITPRGPGREIYLKGPGMIFQGNPRRYVTEIQIPI